MKKLVLIVVGLALISMPVVSFAGIAGSDHDLRTSALASNPDGLQLNLCTSCHLPHNSQLQGKLWAGSAASSDVADLCESCHDGTVVVLGANVFSASSAHVYADALDVTEKQGCSGTGTYCHDVHEQNANGTGKFLANVTYDGTSGVAACGVCHTTGGQATGSNKSGVGNHTMTNIDCGDCHVISTVHGTTSAAAVTQSGGVETNGAGTWLLPVDNNAAGNWGGACVACHEDNAAPYTGTVTGVGRTIGTFENIAFASGLRHNTSGNTRGTDMSGCNACHYVHGNGADTEMLQLVDNTNSAGCKDCHDGTPGPNYAATGNSHPTDVSFTTVGAFPTGSEVNDDAFGGADYSTNAANIICETCHSTHRLGATNGTPFLRAANTSANEICTTCHNN